MAERSAYPNARGLKELEEADAVADRGVEEDTILQSGVRVRASRERQGMSLAP
jgi:hypothetical protein